MVEAKVTYYGWRRPGKGTRWKRYDSTAAPTMVEALSLLLDVPREVKSSVWDNVALPDGQKPSDKDQRN